LKNFGEPRNKNSNYDVPLKQLHLQLCKKTPKKSENQLKINLIKAGKRVVSKKSIPERKLKRRAKLRSENIFNGSGKILPDLFKSP